ncbi:FliM/FliN family flagellar motor C-terminal domain-containing protein [Granulicella sp. dw_53]|uniref:FliM/FliN family flagellar motor C-terminal domain-containing protein n=1 Tax=Granulicella sp. dw_53 TaxID=2719792 RepID=UPI001BD24892|nr:FliM/FliN family flagellar motor C-terminal domain-containing protein [Granulicella sp. dw_53]
MAEAQLERIIPQLQLGAVASEGNAGGTRMEDHLAWPVLSRLPMLLVVRIALTRLKIRDLLLLQEGQILTSEWPQTSDVPLAIGDITLGWSEFEVSGQRIGVRLTHLA